MILNRQTRVRVALAPLEKFARKVRRELRLSSDEMAVCLVSNAEMVRLNRTYRGKLGPTDVLSFPAAKPEKNGARESLLGDIAIAPLVAQRNARRFGRTLSDELRILILHGMLHLLGYDHETDSGQMERRERHLRRRLGVD
jgi:probable rRNA maturation factor